MWLLTAVSCSICREAEDEGMQSFRGRDSLRAAVISI